MNENEEKYLDGAGLERVLTKLKAALVQKTEVQIPTYDGATFTYDGTVKKPTAANFSNFDPEAITITASDNVNAGTYNVTLTLKNTDQYYWEDETTAPKVYQYTIIKGINTVTVSPSSISKTNVLANSTQTVTTSSLAGIASASSSNNSIATASINGSNVVVTFKGSGTATITVTSASDSNYNSSTATISVNITLIEIVSWANGTDAQIAALVAAADNGDIDLYTDCGWRVGDTRSVPMSEIPITQQCSKVFAGNVEFVLMDRGINHNYTLTTNVKDKTGATRTKPSFIVGMKDCLKAYNTELLNNTTGKYDVPIVHTWGDEPLRTPYFNGAFKNALPSALRPIFKQFNSINKPKYSTDTSPAITQEYFTFFALNEINSAASNNSNGNGVYQSEYEKNNLSQISWYATAANRIKKVLQSNNGKFLAGTYYTRSMKKNTFADTQPNACSDILFIYADGNSVSIGVQSANNGFSLFGVI